MNCKVGSYRISQKTMLSEKCVSMNIECPDISEIALPGQFVHIKAEGFSLRRPISICQNDRESGTIRIVFEVRGEGTAKIAELQEGDFIDMIAPLGNGFTLKENAKAVLVGGGIGVPPMLELAGVYQKNCDAIIGFRNADAVILGQELSSLCNIVTLCTDDGSLGVQGLVTLPLEERLKASPPDIIYACGPMPMLKGVALLAKQYNIPCEVSLEERMGCGIGACLVCACKTVKNGEEIFSHVCKDGPVYNSEEVVF